MALAITITDVDTGTGNIYVFGKLTPSGSYATGGDTLDFTTVAAQIGASLTPVQLWAGGTTGDNYGWVPGSTLNNGKIKISLPGYQNFETDIELVANQKSTVKTDLVKGGPAEGTPLPQ